MSSTITITETMTAVPTSTTPSVTRDNSKKRLEGVKANEALFELLRECIDKAKTNSSIGNSSSGNSSTYEVLQSFVTTANIHDENKTKPEYIPLDVIFALQSVLEKNDDNNNNNDNGSSDVSRLEKALRTPLAFTPAPKVITETAEQRKFKERLTRLRWQQEESKYSRLTNNIQKGPQDDVNAKSMTYAASVGLNMIVAPISFGVFMYFFAGGLFDYFLDESFSARTTGGTDIKRVIVGVVSGVLMLFIEMILFVIRTHEFEEHTRRKNKNKKAVQPFGVYTKQSDNVSASPQISKGIDKSQKKD